MVCKFLTHRNGEVKCITLKTVDSYLDNFHLYLPCQASNLHLVQWFLTFLNLQLFNKVPHTLVTPSTINLFSLLLPNCHVAAMNFK